MEQIKELHKKIFGDSVSLFTTAATLCVVFIALFFLVKTIKVGKEIKFVGGGVSATNTIMVSGEGEAFAVPDVSIVRVTLHEEGKTFAATQKKVTEKESKILAFLKEKGIEKKDIKTDNYSINPKYEWQSTPRPAAVCEEGKPCVQSLIACPVGGSCGEGKNVQVGFDAYETLAIKIRNTDTVGEIIDGVGKLAPSEVSTPEYAVDNDDAVVEEARSKAIAQAKAKAQKLADELGVKLIRVVSYSDNGGAMPYMNYAGNTMMAKDVSMTEGTAAPMPELPKGQNKYTANISITYEIR